MAWNAKYAFLGYPNPPMEGGGLLMPFKMHFALILFIVRRIHAYDTHNGEVR